jgi:hypothetical protein
LVWLAAPIALIAGLALGLVSVWLLRPDLLPQQTYYDFVANRQVTERLVDPALVKVERWEILDEEQEVLFVHPTASGSAALVYPVKIEPGTTFQSDLAVAPEAWHLEGDGITFSLYVEDRAGLHLVSSHYLDPKHNLEDRRWVPMRVNLGPYGGQLVRLVLVVSTGPTGDPRNDWAGWAEPQLTRPGWPLGTVFDG